MHTKPHCPNPVLEVISFYDIPPLNVYLKLKSDLDDDHVCKGCLARQTHFIWTVSSNDLSSFPQVKHILANIIPIYILLNGPKSKYYSRDDKVKGKILRLFKIWNERSIYDEVFLSDLCGLLTTTTKKNASAENTEFQVIQGFWHFIDYISMEILNFPFQFNIHVPRGKENCLYLIRIILGMR